MGHGLTSDVWIVSDGNWDQRSSSRDSDKNGKAGAKSVGIEAGDDASIPFPSDKEKGVYESALERKTFNESR